LSPSAIISLNLNPTHTTKTPLKHRNRNLQTTHQTLKFFIVFKGLNMKVAILPVGQVEQNVLQYIQETIPKIFPRTESVILKDPLTLPSEAYNTRRRQYSSSFLATLVREYLKKTDADKILGITTADLYAPRLNFVFGEAECPGKAAIISLHRLKPEFYGQSSNQSLFLERATKETVHEIGHTLGLTHCSNNSCVMFFSNSIIDTDRKQQFFCVKCFETVQNRLKKR